MKTSAGQVELRIPRRAEFVRVARRTAYAVAGELDFTYDVVKDIELAVGEACNNAVEHVKKASCEDIVMRLSVDERRLVIDVWDHGQGFDPSRIDSADAQERDVGGLGITIIRSVMDEVDIKHDAETGTRVHMVKYRARS